MTLHTVQTVQTMCSALTYLACCAVGSAMRRQRYDLLTWVKLCQLTLTLS